MSPIRRLIVNADDLGYDPAIDRGILQAALTGIVTSATVLVTAEFAAAALGAAAATGLGLGLHVNLVRGRPLTRARSLLGPDGALDEARAAAADPSEAADEIRAQVARFEALRGRPPTHLDVHRHAHRHGPVFAALRTVARERGLPVRAVDPTMRHRLQGEGIACADHFVGDAGRDPYWTRDRLLATIRALEPGTTELMCHPGYAPERVRTRYGPQREVELASLCDPAVREALAAAGVERCHFGALAGAPE